MSRDIPERAELLAALGMEFRQLSAATILFHQAVADRLGMNVTDHKCADILERNGPMTAGELAVATGLTTGAITGVIDRLEQAGFARRERDADDRRKVLVKFQPGAERRIFPLFRPMERASMAVLEGYSDKELALLLDVLTRLSDAANAAMAELRTQPNSSTSKSPAKSGK